MIVADNPALAGTLPASITALGRLERLARLEGPFDHAAGLQIANLDPVERLALAGLHEFVLDDRAWIVVDHDLQPATKLVGVVTRHIRRCPCTGKSVDNTGKPRGNEHLP